MVIHWPIVSAPLVNNSTGKVAISAAPIEEQQVTVIEIGPETEVEMGPIVAEARLENVTRVAVILARATDLAVREIAPQVTVEIA